MSEAVKNWLSRLGKNTRPTYAYHFDRFMKWMAENGGDLAELSPEELADYQRNAGNGTKYVILDLVQRHVRETHGRYSYKLKVYTSVRSFFMHNRADLSPDRGFLIKAEKPPVEGTLTIEEVKQVIMTCNPVHRAAFLCILQGGMDEHGFCDWNETGYDALMRDLPEVKTLRREDRVIRIRLPGRKKSRNIKPFYTYIGADAIEAVETWLKRRPHDVEAIFTNQFGDPLSDSSLRNMWSRKLKNLGIIEPKAKPSSGDRYGKNVHEIRDVFRSQWEKSPSKANVGEFCMGHQIDPLEYNKACKDETWTLREYRKALPFLQIMSSGIPFEQISVEEAYKLKNETVTSQQSEIEELRRQIKDMMPAFAAAQKLLNQSEEFNRLRGAPP